MTGDTVNIEIGVWYDEEMDQIKLRIPGQDLTSVTNNPDSKRGNPSLYHKLGRVLRDRGVRHPKGV